MYYLLRDRRVTTEKPHLPLTLWVAGNPAAPGEKVVFSRATAPFATLEEGLAIVRLLGLTDRHCWEIAERATGQPRARSTSYAAYLTAAAAVPGTQPWQEQRLAALKRALPDLTYRCGPEPAAEIRLGIDLGADYCGRFEAKVQTRWRPTPATPWSAIDTASHTGAEGVLRKANFNRSHPQLAAAWRAKRPLNTCCELLEELVINQRPRQAELDAIMAAVPPTLVVTPATPLWTRVVASLVERLDEPGPIQDWFAQPAGRPAFATATGHLAGCDQDWPKALRRALSAAADRLLGTVDQQASAAACADFPCSCAAIKAAALAVVQGNGQPLPDWWAERHDWQRLPLRLHRQDLAPKPGEHATELADHFDAVANPAAAAELAALLNPWGYELRDSAGTVHDQSASLAEHYAMGLALTGSPIWKTTELAKLAAKPASVELNADRFTVRIRQQIDRRRPDSNQANARVEAHFWPTATGPSAARQLSLNAYETAAGARLRKGFDEAYPELTAAFKAANLAHPLDCLLPIQHRLREPLTAILATKPSCLPFGPHHPLFASFQAELARHVSGPREADGHLAGCSGQKVFANGVLAVLQRQGRLLPGEAARDCLESLANYPCDCALLAAAPAAS